MHRLKVLFICVHNSARSQMAEAFLNVSGAERFAAESAGLEPKGVNPLVVEVMQEVGIDISNNKADSVFELFKQGKTYDYVITVCDESNSRRCPLFPDNLTRLDWTFDNPASFTGTRDEIKAQLRNVRDAIKNAIAAFIDEYC